MLTPSRQLTDAEKLRKVILELVDTERAYVKVIRWFSFCWRRHLDGVYFKSPLMISEDV